MIIPSNLLNFENRKFLNSIYMKTILKDVSARLPYLSPECDVLNIKSEGVICGSGFGEEGKPGDLPEFFDFPSFF